MQAKTIDEVIVFLDQIVKDEVKDSSKLAYFPILYRKVTIAIKAAIINKEFEDNTRMERLDVVFANRYLKAYSEFKANQAPSSCWAVSFKEGDKFWYHCPTAHLARYQCTHKPRFRHCGSRGF